MAQIERVMPGGIVKTIPEDFTKHEALKLLLMTGQMSAEEAQSEPEWTQRPWGEGDFMSKGEHALRANANVPLGMGGSLAAGGTTLAATGNPYLAGGAAIVGGMLGEVGGTLLSQDLIGEDRDWGKAVLNGVISGGIDLATIGVGKVAKPIITPAWVAAKKAMGLTPEQASKELIKESSQRTAHNIGTEGSVKETQQMLVEGGATLTPSQTGKASWGQRTAEQIGRFGMFSGGVYRKNSEKIAEVVQKNLDEVMLGEGSTVNALTDMEMGQNVIDVVDAGRAAMNKDYNLRLADINKPVSKDAVAVDPYVKTLKAFLNRKKRSYGRYDLDEQTVKYVEDRLAELESVPQIKANELIGMEKQISTDLNAKTGQDAKYSDNAQREIYDLLQRVKVTTRRELTKVNRKAGLQYRKLNKEYSKDISSLLPRVNKAFIDKTGKGQVSSLGQVLTRADVAEEHVQTLMSQVDQAYRLVEKGGKKAKDSLKFKTSNEMKDAIRQSYLHSKFPDVSMATFNPKNYKRLASDLADPTESAKIKAVMGDSFNHYKRLVNTIATVADEPTSVLGSLVLRSREYGAVEGVLATGTGAGLAAGILGTAKAATGAALVLFTPYMLAKASTNPKVIAKITGILKKKITVDEAAEQLALVADDLVQTSFDAEYVEQKTKDFLLEQ